MQTIKLCYSDINVQLTSFQMCAKSLDPAFTLARAVLHPTRPPPRPDNGGHARINERQWHLMISGRSSYGEWTVSGMM